MILEDRAQGSVARFDVEGSRWAPLPPHVLPLSLLLVIFAVLLRTAWLAEDAFITFRTVDNFINGYGLRWNVDERVQTYTHPLWLLLSALSVVTREVPYTTLVFSLL